MNQPAPTPSELTLDQTEDGRRRVEVRLRFRAQAAQRLREFIVKGFTLLNRSSRREEAHFHRSAGVPTRSSFRRPERFERFRAFTRWRRCCDI